MPKRRSKKTPSLLLVNEFSERSLKEQSCNSKAAIGLNHPILHVDRQESSHTHRSIARWLEVWGRSDQFSLVGQSRSGPEMALSFPTVHPSRIHSTTAIYRRYKFQCRNRSNPLAAHQAIFRRLCTAANQKAGREPIAIVKVRIQPANSAQIASSPTRLTKLCLYHLT